MVFDEIGDDDGSAARNALERGENEGRAGERKVRHTCWQWTRTFFPAARDFSILAQASSRWDFRSAEGISMMSILVTVMFGSLTGGSHGTSMTWTRWEMRCFLRRSGSEMAAKEPSQR